ncbi:MAG: hypothetical protein AB1668_04635 [Nanoarchaeota archaeon]
MVSNDNISNDNGRATNEAAALVRRAKGPAEEIQETRAGLEGAIEQGREALRRAGEAHQDCQSHTGWPGREYGSQQCSKPGSGVEYTVSDSSGFVRYIGTDYERARKIAARFGCGSITILPRALDDKPWPEYVSPAQ